jgi:hypothetical protein
MNSHYLLYKRDVHHNQNLQCEVALNQLQAVVDVLSSEDGADAEEQSRSLALHFCILCDLKTCEWRRLQKQLLQSRGASGSGANGGGNSTGAASSSSGAGVDSYSGGGRDPGIVPDAVTVSNSTSSGAASPSSTAVAVSSTLSESGAPAPGNHNNTRGGSNSSSSNSASVVPSTSMSIAERLRVRRVPFDANGLRKRQRTAVATLLGSLCIPAPGAGSSGSCALAVPPSTSKTTSTGTSSSNGDNGLSANIPQLQVQLQQIRALMRVQNSIEEWPCAELKAAVAGPLIAPTTSSEEFGSTGTVFPSYASFGLGIDESRCRGTASLL